MSAGRPRDMHPALGYALATLLWIVLLLPFAGAFGLFR